MFKLPKAYPKRVLLEQELQATSTPKINALSSVYMRRFSNIFSAVQSLERVKEVVCPP